MDKMDIALKQAFDVLAKEEYENFSRNIPKHRFSVRFRWRMHRMVAKKKKEAKEDSDDDASITELYRTVSKRRLVLMILILMLLISGTILAAKPLLYWLYNRYIKQQEDHVEIMNQEESDNHVRGGFQKYKIMELPEGYRLVEETFDEEFQKYQVGYLDEKENVLYLRQYWEEDEDIGKVTSDASIIEKVEVEGFTGYYVVDKGVSSLVLSDGTYLVVLSGDFPTESLMKIAENLELQDE